MGKPNPQNLNPCNSENARERQLKSAQKRKENNAKKKLMSQIYAEFLEKEYDVKAGDKTKKISGAELCNEAMKKIIARGDSASVSLLREIREGMEGNKIQLSGAIKTESMSAEQRVESFKELMGLND